LPAHVAERTARSGRFPIRYTGLDTSRHQAQYHKAVEAIARDDFRSADVKRLANISHGKFYRARLDYANRLLFTIVRHDGAVYALMLEIIENHEYDKSRFLRGAEVDEDKLPGLEALDAAKEAEPARSSARPTAAACGPRRRRSTAAR